MTEPRSRSLERLASERFDVLVVGAGITGARVAYETARSGLRVALVDAGDVAGATSSASSKLLHGGFRYLSLGSYGLVRSAQAESRVLATRVAPHVSHPLRVVLTIERGRWPEWQLAGGLLLYFALAGFRPPRPRLLAASELDDVAPCLRAPRDGLHVLLHEYQTDDRRLVLSTAAGAERAGAVVVPYLELVSLASANGRLDRAELVDRLSGDALVVRARCVVNATGPWVDRVRLLESSAASPLARLSKGVHLTLPLPEGLDALLAFYSSDDRTSFAAPWRGTLLLGTTDDEHEGDPGAAAASEDDVTAVLDGGRRILGAGLVDRAQVLSAWAGVRVLPRTAGDTARVPREHLTEIGPRGLISVAGGKLTTHRRIAAEVVAMLPAELRPRRLARTDEPLPGAAPTGSVCVEGQVDARSAAHLRSLYGSEADALLAYRELPAALDRIHPDADDLWAQVHYARDHEWACTVDDVVWRRTTLAHRGLATATVREAIASCLHPSPAGGAAPSSPPGCLRGARARRRCRPDAPGRSPARGRRRGAS